MMLFHLIPNHGFWSGNRQSELHLYDQSSSSGCWRWKFKEFPSSHISQPLNKFDSVKTKAHISFYEHVSQDELFGLLEAKENHGKSMKISNQCDLKNPQYNRFQQPLAKPSKWHSSWQRLGTASKPRLETRNRSGREIKKNLLLQLWADHICIYKDQVYHGFLRSCCEHHKMQNGSFSSWMSDSSTQNNNQAGRSPVATGNSAEVTGPPSTTSLGLGTSCTKIADLWTNQLMNHSWVFQFADGIWRSHGISGTSVATTRSAPAWQWKGRWNEKTFAVSKNIYIYIIHTI